MEICSLMSGSGGNSLYCRAGDVQLLVDVGLSCRAEEMALSSLHVDPASLNGVLVTHEHSDHIKGLDLFCSRYGIPVFATGETLEYIRKNTKRIDGSLFREIRPQEDFYIRRMNILPFSIPHDAANPVGYSLFSAGVRATTATDLGHMTDSVFSVLKESDFVLLESNYDPDMLRNGPYPQMLKSRIAGRKGHLSNPDCAKTAANLMQEKVSCLLLGHMSRENNIPELAMNTVQSALSEYQLFHAGENVHLTYYDHATPMYRME